MAQLSPIRLASTLLSALLLTTPPLPATAQVTKYKCIYGNGEVSLQNEPCGHIPPSQRTPQGRQAMIESQRAEREAQDAAAAARIRSLENKHAEEKYLDNAMFSGQVVVGMNKDQVLRVWGRPDNISNYASSGGYQSEDWTYYSKGNKPYRSVDFKDGKVSRVYVSQNTSQRH